MIQRLRTRPQFQAVLADAPVAKTAHFALHRLPLDPNGSAASLFPACDAWLGVVLPKRWARRAVTRNAIRRQVYATAALAPLPCAAHVVRLRAAFSREQFVSARSAALTRAVRDELLTLWARAQRAPAAARTGHVA